MFTNELTEEFKNLLVHYTYKKNRIRAFAKDTRLPDFFIRTVFSISQKELYQIVYFPHKHNLNYSFVKRKIVQFNFDKHQAIGQNLVRLR